MIRWLLNTLLGKRIERQQALERYLNCFNRIELDYLNNLALMGISNDLLVRKDPYKSVEVATYIHTALMARAGVIENSVKALSSARRGVRIAIVRAIKPAIRGASIFGLFADFEANVSPLRPEEEERLANHLTMIKRIYDHPRDAPILPELRTELRGS